jgi:hypothetical protein
MTSNSKDLRSSLGGRLQGVQHFGGTVQNMGRAFEFYTEVLGGTEVLRDGDSHGGRIHARCPAAGRGKDGRREGRRLGR